MFKLDLEKAEEPEIKLPTSFGSLKKQENSRKASTSASLIMLVFDCMDHNKLWKILKDMGLPCHWPASWEISMQVKKQQLEMEMEKRTGFKLGKEYVKAVYCHFVYLTYMQSISCEVPDWMKHKLKSRLLGKTAITSDMQMIPFSWQRMKRN